MRFPLCVAVALSLLFVCSCGSPSGPAPDDRIWTEWIAYAESLNTVAIIAPDGVRDRLCSDLDGQARFMAWFPGGDEFLVCGDEAGGGLQRIARDSGAMIDIAPGASSIQAFDVSHDGRVVAYDALVEGVREIWIGQASAFHPAKLVTGSTPLFSRNGQLVAFNRSDSVGVIHPDGTASEMLARGSLTPSPRGGAWSVTGLRLLTCRDGRVIALDLVDGTEDILSTTASCDCPAWSPDGSRAAFWLHAGTDLWDLVLVDSDGGEQATLLHSVHVNAERPSWTWSPDGSRIAFLTSSTVSVVDVASHEVAVLGARTGQGGALDWIGYWADAPAGPLN